MNITEKIEMYLDEELKFQTQETKDSVGRIALKYGYKQKDHETFVHKDGHTIKTPDWFPGLTWMFKPKKGKEVWGNKNIDLMDHLEEIHKK